MDTSTAPAKFDAALAVTFEPSPVGGVLGGVVVLDLLIGSGAAVV